MTSLIDFPQLAIDTAALSPCAKRKVGAVAVFGKYYATGHNHNNGNCCELDDGSTDPNTKHAEIEAIEKYKQLWPGLPSPDTIYVTQPPCAACQEATQLIGIKEIIVVEEFMKYDSEKLRYELIPPSTTLALARVLTYGARKYKPDNWRKGEVDRYVGAAYRHLEAWRQGEKRDPESGLLHLEHLLTNIAFLLELDKENGPQEESQNV